MSDSNHEQATGLLTAILGLKLTAIFGAGVLGAACIAAFDPPTDRKQLFLQASTAGVGSLVFGPVVLALVKHFSTWVDWSTLDIEQSVAYAAPIYFVTGALAWGFFGAMSKLRKMISDRGAAMVAKRMGLPSDDEEKK